MASSILPLAESVSLEKVEHCNTDKPAVFQTTETTELNASSNALQPTEASTVSSALPVLNANGTPVLDGETTETDDEAAVPPAKRLSVCSRRDSIVSNSDSPTINSQFGATSMDVLLLAPQFSSSLLASSGETGLNSSREMHPNLKRSASVDNAADCVPYKRQRRLSTPLLSHVQTAVLEVFQSAQTVWGSIIPEGAIHTATALEASADSEPIQETIPTVGETLDANQPVIQAHDNLVLSETLPAGDTISAVDVSEATVDVTTEVTSTCSVAEDPTPMDLDSAPMEEKENKLMEIAPLEANAELTTSDQTLISTSGIVGLQSFVPSQPPIQSEAGIEISAPQLDPVNASSITTETSLPSALPLPMVPTLPSLPIASVHYTNDAHVTTNLESQSPLLTDAPSTPELQQHQFLLHFGLPLANPTLVEATATSEVTPPLPPPLPSLTIVTNTSRKRGTNASGGDQQQQQPPSGGSTPTSTSASGGKRSRNGKQPKSKSHVTPSPPMSPAPYPNSSAATTPSAGIAANNVCVPTTAITTRRRKSRIVVNETTIAEDSRDGAVGGDRADEEELYCTCRRPYDPSKFMICCDGCDDWFHGTCVDVSEEAGELVDKYYCPGCSAKGRTSSWKAKCFRNGCSRPALVPVSKYCSQRCGIRVAEEILKQQDDRVQKIKRRRDRKLLSEEAKGSNSRKSSIKGGRKDTGRKDEKETIKNEEVGFANQENVPVEKEMEEGSNSQGETVPETLSNLEPRTQQPLPAVSDDIVPSGPSESDDKFPEQDEQARGATEKVEEKKKRRKRKRKSTVDGELWESDAKVTGTDNGKGKKGRNRRKALSISQDSPCPSGDSPASAWHSSPPTCTPGPSSSSASSSSSHSHSSASSPACGPASSDSPSPPAPPPSAADNDNHARLRTLEELKNAAREALVKVRKRSKYLEGAIKRAMAMQGKTRIEDEAIPEGEVRDAMRVCGFDTRLLWGDGCAEAEVEAWESLQNEDNTKIEDNSEDGIRKRRKLEDGASGPSDLIGAEKEIEKEDGGQEATESKLTNSITTFLVSHDVCMVPVESEEKEGARIFCEKHSGWENLKKAELENEMRLQTLALFHLQEEEKQVLARVQGGPSGNDKVGQDDSTLMGQ